MKASPTEQRELLNLQQIDTEIARLDHAAANLVQDVELERLAPRLAEARREHIERTGELEDARARLGRAESDVQVVEARMNRDSDRLQHTSSLKDVQGLEAELESLRARRSELEDIQLAVMEQIDGIEARLKGSEASKNDLQSEAAELEEAKGHELAGIEVRRTQLAADRATVADRVGAELLSLYEKQRSRYGVGAALLRGAVSLGSNTTLNPADLEEIRRAAPDDVLLCPESSCILVRTEESAL